MVVRGWDPPSSAPACPPSPHTSRLFIMNCGKERPWLRRLSPAGFTVLRSHANTHITLCQLPPTIDHGVSGLNEKKKKCCGQASTSGVLVLLSLSCIVTHLNCGFYLAYLYIFILMTNTLHILMTNMHFIFVLMDNFHGLFGTQVLFCFVFIHE